MNINRTLQIVFVFFYLYDVIIIINKKHNDMESTAESLGYYLGYVLGILIIGVILALIGKLIFPKSSFNKRLIWGIIIAVGLALLNFCRELAPSIYA